jgi:quinol monooxygenase YgiN
VPSLNSTVRQLEGFPASLDMSKYSYIWEFRVAPARVADFERHYGANGTWAELFRQSPGYINTQLLHDNADPLRYVTIDNWTGIEAYRHFCVKFAQEYSELDRLCAGLTTNEVALGEFSE